MSQQPYESAAEITALFTRMQVPLKVVDTKEKGKHVLTTMDIKDDSTQSNEDGSRKFGLKHRGGKTVASFDLFEETALVSWPTSEAISTIARNVELLQSSGAATPPFALVGASNWSLKLLYADEKGNSDMYPATTVPTSLLSGNGDGTHSLTMASKICFIYGDETEQQQDTIIAALLGSRGALLSLRNYHSALEARSEETYPTSVESVARCVTKAVSTFVQLFVRLSSEDGAAPVVSKEGDFDLVDKLFEASVRGFNRLVEPPKNSSYEGYISASEWAAEVRTTLQANIEGLLCALHNAASASTGGSSPISLLVVKDGILEMSMAGGAATGSDDVVPGWVSRVVDGWLSDDTLSSLLGQITLNAQALVAFSEVEGGVIAMAEVMAPQASDATGAGGVVNSTIVTRDNIHSKLPIYGVGMYTLQSNFNHSCQPNAYVVPPLPYGLGGHDIIVRAFTDRESADGEVIIKANEELCITYIPELYLHCEGFNKRRERLSSYFFDCRCTKCLAEEKAAAGVKKTTA